MNRYGNHCSSYGDGYHYTNADGSRYFSNPDGSSFYDPGPSGKGRKWYCSPNGEKRYIDEDDDHDQKEEDEQDSWQYQESDGNEDTEYLTSPSPEPRKFTYISIWKKPNMQRSRRHVEGEEPLTRPDPNQRKGRQDHPIPNINPRRKRKFMFTFIRGKPVHRLQSTSPE